MPTAAARRPASAITPKRAGASACEGCADLPPQPSSPHEWRFRFAQDAEAAAVGRAAVTHTFFQWKPTIDGPKLVGKKIFLLSLRYDPDPAKHTRTTATCAVKFSQSDFYGRSIVTGCYPMTISSRILAISVPARLVVTLCEVCVFKSQPPTERSTT